MPVWNKVRIGSMLRAAGRVVGNHYDWEIIPAPEEAINHSDLYDMYGDQAEIADDPPYKEVVIYDGGNIHDGVERYIAFAEAGSAVKSGRASPYRITDISL